MTKRNKNKGGRPPLGTEKRVQQTITFHPAVWDVISKMIEDSGVNDDGRTHKLTLSAIVEKAVRFTYRNEFHKASVEKNQKGEK